MPARRASVAPRRRRGQQLLVGRRPGGRDRHVDAAGRVRRAGHARRELGGAVAGEDEVGVAVDEPRDHARPVDVDALVGGRRPTGADRDDAPVVDHDVGVDELARRGVRDEAADALEHASSRQHAPQLAGHVQRRVQPVAHDDAATDHDMAHVGRRRRRTRRRASASSLAVPAVRTESSVTVVRSARAPASMRPASGQPSARWPCSVAIRRSAAVSWRPRTQRRQALVELDGPGLLEEVDDGVRVAAERQAGAGVAQGERRADAVGEVALRRRADAARAPRRAEQPDVGRS